MSYKKFLKNVSLPKAHMGIKSNYSGTPNVYDKYRNILPMVYQGPQNRMERYTVYDGMEQDPVIAWALDTLTDYVTQLDKDKPFHIKYSDDMNLPDSYTNSLELMLSEWVKKQDWKKRIYTSIRDTFKYGDTFFIRDPETLELHRVNIYDVLGIVVDEKKVPTHYVIRNVELNVPMKIASTAASDIQTKNFLNTLNGNLFNVGNTMQTQIANVSGDEGTTLPIEAKYVVHLTLNVDNILVYPYGVSILESIYKTYIQKMLLQDCILLYRIKNATEKLVFTIPVGNVPRYKRKQYLEKCKNDLSQRRMPSKDSEGVFSCIDVAYNSIPMNEDYWLAVDSDGITPKIEKLAGGQNLGEINDMVYWENLLIRGLKVPQSWVPYGPTDGESRNIPTSTASTYVQEQRFLKYCQRMQDILIGELDAEFKRYVKYRGVEINEESYELAFFTPSNITELTEEEIRKSRLETFSSACNNPYISKQFALKFYLKLTDEEFNENQRLLAMENQEKFKDKDVPLPTSDLNQIPGLRTVGIEDISNDDLNDLINDINADSNAGSGDMSGMGMGSGDMSGMGSGDMSGGMGMTSGDMGMGGTDMSGGSNMGGF